MKISLTQIDKAMKLTRVIEKKLNKKTPLYYYGSIYNAVLNKKNTEVILPFENNTDFALIKAFRDKDGDVKTFADKIKNNERKLLEINNPVFDNTCEFKNSQKQVINKKSLLEKIKDFWKK